MDTFTSIDLGLCAAPSTSAFSAAPSALSPLGDGAPTSAASHTPDLEGEHGQGPVDFEVRESGSQNWYCVVA
jgi:hypothetical protein